jgi:hypothetical protein
MLSRYNFLAGLVRVTESGKRGIFIPILPIAFCHLRSTAASCDGLLGLIPGQAGRAARGAADIVNNVLAVLMDEGLLVDVRVRSSEENVRVKIRMW